MTEPDEKAPQAKNRALVVMCVEGIGTLITG